jgi:hypothetical protein
MLSLFRPRLFCATAEPLQSAAKIRDVFSGRSTTQSNPRTLAPVVTQHVLRDRKSVDFTCVGRGAASKLIHAVAIANAKNVEERRAFFKPLIAHGLKMDDGSNAKSVLTPFKISLFPETVPRHFIESGHMVRRTKISAHEDHEELAKNIHLSYMRKTPLVLECMGEKAMGIITHSIALFNDRVKAHDLSAYVHIITGKGPDGSDIVKMEFQLVEQPKTN